MIHISNGVLDVTINEKGATLAGVRKDGEEFLWQGDEKSWKSSDIVIFPFVARLKEGWYLDGGKKYEMKPHGVARPSIFEITQQKEDSVTLTLVPNDNILENNYPYKFSFSVKYTVQDNKLMVAYSVKNNDIRVMPFSLGTHAGWILDGEEDDNGCDTSGNNIEILADAPFEEYVFDDETHLVKGKKISDLSNVIELSKPTFAHDAVVMKNKAKRIIIHRKNGHVLTFDIGEVPVLAIWSHAKFGKYACVEAWWGLPDEINPNREMIDKPLINKLQPNQIFTYNFDISIN